MYKMEVYRSEENTLFKTEKSNNLEYFDKYKNKTNYKIKIFQKVKNRWKLIYSEQQINGIFHGQLEAIIENKSIVAFIVFMRH